MYHEIASDLIEAIRKKEFTVKLPTELQLMARYQVSRNTIRRALDVVYQQGLLRRVQGSGFFINQVPVKMQTTLNLSTGAGMTNLTERLRSQVVSFDKVVARDISLARKLQVKPETELYRIIRLRYYKEQLYDYEEAYYFRELVPFISPESLRESIFDFVKESYGITVATSDDFISLGHLSKAEATLLGAEPGEARLVLEQQNYTKNYQVFNFARTIYASEELRFYLHSGHLASS